MYIFRSFRLLVWIKINLTCIDSNIHIFFNVACILYYLKCMFLKIPIEFSYVKTFKLVCWSLFLKFIPTMKYSTS